MLGLISGYWASQLVMVAARLGIADVLAKGPRTVDAIAKHVGAHPPFLGRVLRALASLGVFAETPDGRFRLTPAAATLRTGVPGSLKDFADMMVDDYNWQAWSALHHGVTTGERPFDHVLGKPAFEYLKEHPDKERVFAASMASISARDCPAVARAYDFGTLTRLVDVGGSHGHLLATVLRRFRRLRGVLYDQPQVVATAAASGHLNGLEERCEIVGGDFFTSVPEGADGYMMKYIIHDWDDARSIRILRNCRDAMAPDGRVLVIEHEIACRNRPDWAKLLDINMLVIPGGMERTRDEFRALFDAAGLKLRRVVRTKAPVSVFEAVRA
jgi:O-methyltransferase/methyltransferase family protein